MAALAATALAMTTTGMDAEDKGMARKGERRVEGVVMGVTVGLLGLQ